MTPAHCPVWQSHMRTVPSLLPEYSLSDPVGNAIPVITFSWPLSGVSIVILSLMQ
uniref:Uncharacterized protein n=1 Tax=Arundo donax TaxID=35708 RepID=A0A0A9EXG7_ARUDO